MFREGQGHLGMLWWPGGQVSQETLPAPWLTLRRPWVSHAWTLSFLLETAQDWSPRALTYPRGCCPLSLPPFVICGSFPAQVWGEKSPRFTESSASYT